MIRIRLFRHGESASNAGEKTDWPRNVPLTPRGHVQAECIAELASCDSSKIVVSDYIRTTETAKPLASKVLVPVEIWPVHEFTYLDTVECNMTTHRDRAPMRKRYWGKMDPDYVDGPGAESFNQLLGRVSVCLEKMREEKITDGHLDVFSHADFIRAVLFSIIVPATGRTIQAFRQFCQATVIPNAACVRILHDSRGFHVSGPDVSYLPSELITGIVTGSGSP